MAQDITTREALQRACELAGGQSALAEQIGTSQSQIWFWMNEAKKGVPPEFCPRIEAAVGGQVRRDQLRPDIFEPPAEASTEVPAE